MRPDILLIIVRVIADFAIYLWLCAKPSRNLAAENLFLRKQLALFKERQIKPRSTDPASRFTMAQLSQRFDWRDALVFSLELSFAGIGSVIVRSGELSRRPADLRFRRNFSD